MIDSLDSKDQVLAVVPVVTDPTGGTPLLDSMTVLVELSGRDADCPTASVNWRLSAAGARTVLVFNWVPG